MDLASLFEWISQLFHGIGPVAFPSTKQFHVITSVWPSRNQLTPAKIHSSPVLLNTNPPPLIAVIESRLEHVWLTGQWYLQFLGCLLHVHVNYCWTRQTTSVSISSDYASKGKAVPLQARRGPEDSKKLRFPDFVTTAQDSGRLSALRTGHLYPQEILLVLISVDGPGSSVGIATDHGLGGPGSNPCGDEIFYPSRPALWPTQPPVQRVPGLSRG